MRATSHARASCATRGDDVTRAQRGAKKSSPRRALRSHSSTTRVRSSGSADGAPADVLGVVIVDHGSRRKESNEQLETFAEAYARATGRDIVEAAHMELASPSIADAFGRCVERGANLVVVAPFFLSPGRHWQEDIPRLAAEAAEAHPGVRHLVSAPIGLHPLMAEVIDSRMRHCLARSRGEDVGACDVCEGSKFGCELLK